MKTNAALKKELLSCPGDTIQEHLDAIGMTQAELAERMGRSISKLNDLIKGKISLTPETAQKLEYVLGVEASFWLNLERIYQQELLEIEKLEFLEKCEKWIDGFPISKLKTMGFLPKSRKKGEIIDGLLRFFQVASPTEWESVYIQESLAYKINLQYSSHPKVIATWLRMGEIQAEKMSLKNFDKKKITESIPLIQKLIYRQNENWLIDLQEICASCGIALVYTPSISKAPVYGVSRWIKNKTIPLIQLTDRRKDYNAFWFSFFHELAHIRYHNKGEVFISGLDGIKQNEEKEKEANQFAARMLLSLSDRQIIFSHETFTKELILEFSSQLKKHPSIIVSQIQREYKHLYKRKELNQLKKRVEFEKVF